MASPIRPTTQMLRLLDDLIGFQSGWTYGYDLSKRTGIGFGTLYPQLMRLEEAGWLEAAWEQSPPPGKPARHLYRLTEAGRSGAAEALAAGVLASRRARAKLREVLA